MRSLLNVLTLDQLVSTHQFDPESISIKDGCIQRPSKDDWEKTLPPMEVKHNSSQIRYVYISL